ncbi:GNAT family N-acetyltransferase [Angustibacter sp. McL0619]|uniref:GNAT family N-acetyltransferase n=1 Tax=Angustibacter sp. McL0619 TaxID=3415676 RepID=UPI003CFA1063
MQPPTLTDDEQPDAITLRQHTVADVDACLQMCQDPQMQRWTTVPVPYQRQHAEEFIAGRAAEWERDGDCTWAIEATDQDGARRFAGNLSLRPNGTGAAELGFALAPWARGRGVMSRAVRLALGWAFASIDEGGAGQLVVHWRAHVGNWASRRVAWACGFRIEGTVRGLVPQRGVMHDAWIGSVVPGDELAPTSAWLEVPTLADELVRLRPWRADDVPRVVEGCADERTQRWLPGLPSPYTLADAQWYVGSREEEAASGTGIYWCVADAASDTCLGAISLMKLDGPLADREIGYWAHPDARARGVLTAAARLVIGYALAPVDEGGLGVDRVTLRAATDNSASRAVAERAGLCHYGTAHRVDRLRDGSVQDLELYEALADVVPQA